MTRDAPTIHVALRIAASSPTRGPREEREGATRPRQSSRPDMGRAVRAADGRGVLLLATHMFVPSNAIAPGSVPTGKGPASSRAPAVDSSMSLPPKLTTHRLVPSNAIALGDT